MKQPVAAHTAKVKRIAAGTNLQIATVTALLAIGPSASEHTALLDVSTFAFVPVALCGAWLGLRVFYRLSDRGSARYLALLLIASGIGLVGVR